MQKLSVDKDKISEEVVYQGVTFTITKLVYVDGERHIIAEGISRRSHVDPPNPELGKEISLGRALKALKKKLLHEPIRHNLMG